MRADGHIPARTQRTVLSIFQRAIRLGEERARISAKLLDDVYGKDLGPLLDRLEGSSWECEGAVGNDVVFVRQDAVRARKKAADNA